MQLLFYRLEAEMKIVIIDGQGGKVGRTITEKLKQKLPDMELTVIGTNSIATANMLKAGAEYGATGENPVVLAAETADIIIGVIGIAIPHSLLGEVTPKMAEAVGKSPAQKILIPSSRCKNFVVGTENYTLNDLTEGAVNKVLSLIDNK